MPERRHAFGVGEVDVGPGGQQQLDDLLVPGPAVAEDDRLEERGPAELVDVIDIDASLNLIITLP